MQRLAAKTVELMSVQGAQNFLQHTAQ